MTYRTHVVGGLLLSAAVATAASLPIGQLVAAGTVGSVASLLPDLDMPNSKASRSGFNRLIAYPLNKLFGHRSFIHSPVLWLCLTGVLVLLGAPIWLWAGFLAGTLSHLLLDSLNPGGIPWLWPWKKKFHLLGIKTNSTGEILVLAALIMLCITVLPVILQRR